MTENPNFDYEEVILRYASSLGNGNYPDAESTINEIPDPITRTAIIMEFYARAVDCGDVERAVQIIGQIDLSSTRERLITEHPDVDAVRRVKSEINKLAEEQVLLFSSRRIK